MQIEDALKLTQGFKHASATFGPKGWTIRASNSKPRRKPQTGDTKMVRGVKMIRRQVRSRDGWHVRNGRPIWEWVTEETFKEGGSC